MEAPRREDPSVYRRRRLLVTILGVLVVIAVAWLVTRLGGGKHPVEISTSGSTSAIPTNGATTSTGADSSVSGPSINADGSCTPEDVSILASVTGGGSATGVSVEFQVRSLKAAACTWQFSADTTQVVISLDGTDIWDTIECASEFPNTALVLNQTEPQKVDFTWDARFSSPNCPAETRWADPGNYDLQVAALGGEPSTTAFTLLADNTSASASSSAGA